MVQYIHSPLLATERPPCAANFSGSSRELTLKSTSPSARAPASDVEEECPNRSTTADFLSSQASLSADEPECRVKDPLTIATISIATGSFRGGPPLAGRCQDPIRPDSQKKGTRVALLRLRARKGVPTPSLFHQRISCVPIHSLGSVKSAFLVHRIRLLRWDPRS